MMRSSPSFTAGLAAAMLSSIPFSADAGVSFTQSTLDFDGLGSVTSSTAIDFGPDGRLYVLQLDGTIKIFTVTRDGPSDYRVTDAQTLTQVRDIPNHDDDGTPNGAETERLATGLTVAGTAQNPVIYASSGDPRVGAGPTDGDLDLDTNSCVITRLTWNGSSWDAVDLVRGLGHNEENHVTNGLKVAEIDGSPWLLVSQGGFTNAGCPSLKFAYASEYAMAAAVLAVDLAALDSMAVQNDGARDYVYDLPTVDDPTRANANGITDPDDPGYDGIDVGDPWGGNDGLNQARVVPEGPVRIFAPGFRNTYALVVTRAGALYVSDNGANQTWGGFPENEGPGGAVTNNFRPGEPGSVDPDPVDGEEPVNNLDHITCITTDLDAYEFGSFYGGHPCPTRANPSGSGLYTRGAHSAAAGGLFFDDDWFRTVPYDPDGAGEASDPSKALPADWPPLPDSLANPIEGDFRNPGGTNPDGDDDVLVTTWIRNSNAIEEYTAGNFGGSLRGNLIVGRNNGGNLHRIALNPDGTLDYLHENFQTGLGGNALGIACVGPADSLLAFELWGSIWVGTYNSAIVVLEPDDAGVAAPESAPVPAVSHLLPARPNPFRTRTTIEYEIVEAGNVRVRVFDVAGRLVRSLVDGLRGVGSYRAIWDGRDEEGHRQASGVYHVRLEAAGMDFVRVVRLQ